MCLGGPLRALPSPDALNGAAPEPDWAGAAAAPRPGRHAGFTESGHFPPHWDLSVVPPALVGGDQLPYARCGSG
ncbi:hypothetical protein GCM10017688_33590 [Streptomyces ramulosus]